MVSLAENKFYFNFQKKFKQSVRALFIIPAFSPSSISSCPFPEALASLLVRSDFLPALDPLVCRQQRRDQVSCLAELSSVGVGIWHP